MSMTLIDSHEAGPVCCGYAQAFQQSMDELSAKLSAMADLNDELKQVKTKHEMTAKQNADMFIKLQV